MTIDTNVQTDDGSHKRKREEQDIGDRQEKKIHVEDRELRIEDLHQDVGYIYQLCRTRKAPFFNCSGPLVHFRRNSFLVVS